LCNWLNSRLIQKSTIYGSISKCGFCKLFLYRETV
jgi:hypothetical protein